MARVLLVNPSFTRPKINHVLFPFGISYLAANLMRNGHQVHVWDIYIETTDYEKVKEKLSSGFLAGYDHIGITGIITQYLYIEELVADIKSVSSATVTVGGPLATYSYEIMLRHTGTDVCCIGQGEFTYCEIVDSHKELKDIRGIAFQNPDGSLHITDPRPPIRTKDLSELPQAVYELFDMEYYLSHTGMMDVIREDYLGQRVMPLITARGCPYSCRFCSKSTYGVALRSIDEIVDEIRFFMNTYHISCFRFIDELSVISKKRTLELCERLKPLGIRWDAQARANLVDKEMLSAMKDAGCVCVGFGVESGSKRILRNMNKKITPKQIENSLNWCREIGLPVKVQLIYGYPGECEDTLRDTINLFKRTRYPARRFLYITPLPGAPLYEEAKKDGFIGRSLQDSISEEDFIRFICHFGMCNEKLFYNRTCFDDTDFVQKCKETELRIVVNFLMQMVTNPIYFYRHWSVYRHYLKSWWDYRHQLKYFNTVNRLIHILLLPPKAVKKAIQSLGST